MTTNVTEFQATEATYTQLRTRTMALHKIEAFAEELMDELGEHHPRLAGVALLVESIREEAANAIEA